MIVVPLAQAGLSPAPERFPRWVPVGMEQEGDGEAAGNIGPVATRQLTTRRRAVGSSRPSPSQRTAAEEALGSGVALQENNGNQEPAHFFLARFLPSSMMAPKSLHAHSLFLST